MHIPVLTYHSLNILGNDYHNNDHIAFAEDLMLIKSLGIEIISAHLLVKWLKNEIKLDTKTHYLVLTFDDGSELDYYDWSHPEFGAQKSFFNHMQEYKHTIHATSFVIASANARKTLESTCLASHSIWGDYWWQQAEDSKLISIENHSWDHLHITLDKVAQCDNLKGDFTKITTLKDATQQITQASDYINDRITNKHTQLFAYPYGHINDYLVNHYFPNQQTEIHAAFTCEPQQVSQKSSVWKIPRYVCGLHWQSTQALKRILKTVFED